MRPPLLNPLFAPITTLTGIGSKVERLYRRLLGREDTPRIVDLLFHLPSGTIMPESVLTKSGAMFEARRVLSATTAQLRSTVSAEERRTVSVIEAANRPAAARLAGGRHDQAPSPISGASTPASMNIGTALRLVFAARQAIARISQSEWVSTGLSRS